MVEDERPIREGLVELFGAQGMVAEGVGDGAQALERLARGSVDLLVLDIMLPGLDGLSVLRALRARGDVTPTLLLTAKGTEDDVVRGLELGADDYVTKPFGIHALSARVKGLLRRSQRAPGEAVRVLRTDGVVFDYERLVVERDAARVSLTSREAELLWFLAKRAHRVVSREELLVDVWGYQDGSIQTRTVDVHILQLRQKLTAVAVEGWVGTVRGRGYRFMGTVAAEPHP